MTKQDFLESLRRTLNGNMSPVTVDEHIRFYDGYIISEAAKGKSETDIIAGLGDPRILARTLIDAAERAGDSYAQRGGDSGSEEFQARSAAENTGYVKKAQMPGWLIAILVIVVALIAIRIIGTIIFALLPYIIPVVIVVYVIKLIRRE